MLRSFTAKQPAGTPNPFPDIARIVNRHDRRLILDAMSSFGALPIDMQTGRATVVIASSNKCLEGVPGVSFAVIERSAISAVAGNCPSLSLDLHARSLAFETSGQWRFTPPVQVVAALVEALRRLEAEGGPPARLRRYQSSMRVLLLRHGTPRLKE